MSSRGGNKALPLIKASGIPLGPVIQTLPSKAGGVGLIPGQDILLCQPERARTVGLRRRECMLDLSSEGEGLTSL